MNNINSSIINKFNICYGICLSSTIITGLLTYIIVVWTKTGYEFDLVTSFIISHGIIVFCLYVGLRMLIVISFFKYSKIARMDKIRNITIILFTFTFAVDMINDIFWTGVIFL